MFFLFCIGAIFTQLTYGDIAPLELSKDKHRYSVVNHAEFLIDTSQQLTIEDIAMREDLDFTVIEVDTLNLGHPSKPIWLRIAINNPNELKQALNLEIDYARFNYINFYWHLPAGGFGEKKTGLSMPFATRDRRYKSFVFEFIAPAKELTYIYVKLQTTHAVFIPLAISTERGFSDHALKDSYILATFFGIYIAMILYNIFLFISLRVISYLYYVIFMMCLFYFQFSFFGYNVFIFPTAFWWNNTSIILFIFLSTLTGMVFTRDFLRTKENNPILDKVLVGFIVVDGLFVIACLTIGAEHLATAASITALMISVADIVAGFRRWFQGFQPAKFYLLSWGVLVSGIAVLILESLGVIQVTGFSRWGLQIGAAGEAVLLSFALAYQINLLKRRQIDSEKEVIVAHAESRAKSEFLSKMSHEIRTPLNGMLGMIYMLKDSQLDKSQEHYLEIADNSGKALLNVINDVLDYSKIAAGKMELEQVSFELEKLVNESLSLFSIYAHEKNITLFMSIASNVPRVVVGDPTRLRQVVANLVSNALKFTEHGEISVRITLADFKNKSALKFIVKDTGIGISKEGLEKLFKSFSQVDNTTTRRFGGTGLGLAISKEFIQLMGGDINVESELHLGTKFIFTVLLPEGSLEDEEDQLIDITLKGQSVLLIDSSYTYCEAMKEQAMLWHLNIDIAQNNRQALEIAQNLTLKPFDIIVVDCAFSPKDSFNLVKEIRSLSWGKKVKVILTKAYQQVLNQGQLAELKIDSVLVKPTAPFELKEALLLVQDSLNLITNKENETQKLIKYPGLKVLIAEDNSVNQMVIKGLLKKFNVVPDVAENGQQAIRLYQSNLSNPYHLILMDIEMPIMDGYTATKRIREIENSKDISQSIIYALSAHALQEHEQASMDAGMNGHLKKPIDFNLLKAAIEQWFGENDIESQ